MHYEHGGGKYPIHASRGVWVLHQGKKNAFVQREHAFMHLGALIRLNFSCALLSMVSRPLPHFEESAIFEHFISVVSSRCPCLRWWGHGNHAYVHAWCMDWRRRSPARFSKSRKRSKVDPVRVPEVEAKSNLSSGPVWSPRVVRNKTDAQVAYGVGFGRYICSWKHNFIELPMAPVSCQNSFWVNGNMRNKLTSRICQGAMPIPFGLLAQQEAHVGLGYCSHVWTVPGTVALPLVAARGCIPYLDRPLIYFQTWVWFIC
jgi:hypothetical protein